MTQSLTVYDGWIKSVYKRLALSFVCLFIIGVYGTDMIKAMYPDWHEAIGRVGILPVLFSMMIIGYFLGYVVGGILWLAFGGVSAVDLDGEASMKRGIAAGSATLALGMVAGLTVMMLPWLQHSALGFWFLLVWLAVMLIAISHIMRGLAWYLLHNVIVEVSPVAMANAAVARAAHLPGTAGTEAAAPPG